MNAIHVNWNLESQSDFNPIKRTEIFQMEKDQGVCTNALPNSGFNPKKQRDITASPLKNWVPLAAALCRRWLLSKLLSRRFGAPSRLVILSYVHRVRTSLRSPTERSKKVGKVGEVPFFIDFAKS